MALQKEFQAAFGGSFPEAYHRIASVNFVRTEPPALEIKVAIYINEQTRREGKLPVEVQTWCWEVPAEQSKIGSVAELYEKLKRLPVYEKALDV